MLYTGVTGKIVIDDTPVVHMSNWNVELSKEMIEVVSFGDDYKEKVPSIKDWSASGEGSTDFDNEGGQAQLHEAFESGRAVKADFHLDETTFLSGTAYVESLSISTAADGKADISISLAGSGANTLTVPTGG